MDELKTFADPDRLPALLAALASDPILLAIAQQDYGRDVEKHLDLLKQVRGGHYSLNPRTHHWHPLEVMELVRWCEPGVPGYYLHLPERDQHIARAFCCAIMLRIAGDYPTPGYMGDGNETLIQMVRSVAMLGADAEMAAFLFLCWRLSRTAIIGDDEAFFALATLYLYLRISIAPDLPLADYHQKHDAWRALFRDLEALIAGISPDAMSALYELKIQVGAT